MSYLSDTFGVPLGKQFKQPDLQVTPESLMAPQQPFGALNAIGVSQPQPQVNVGPSSTPPLWQQPVDTSNQYDYAPNSAYQSPTTFPSPALAKLGIGAPKLEDQLSASNVSQNPNTPGAFPAPAQLLDMPTRDQGKESKRLANMAGVGGILGLLLGGGAGALQGASSAVQGGSQALDFAAQNDAQKVQVENQKRLQEAANERQSWMDNLTLEDQQYQRKRQKETDDFNQSIKIAQQALAEAKSDNDVLRRLGDSRKNTLSYVSEQVDSEGSLLPSAALAIESHNALAVSAGHPEAVIDPNSVGPSATALKKVKDAQLAQVRIAGMIQNQDFLKQVIPLRVMLESNKITLQEAESAYKELRNQYYPDLMKATVAEKRALATDLPTYLGLRQRVMESQVKENNAQAEKVSKGVEPVDPIQRRQIESVASSMDTDGWNKTVAAINAKYKDRIGGYTFGPDTPMGKAQALAEAQRDKEIEQAKTDRIQKAEKLGFTNVKFTGGSFTYDLPPTKRKAEVPTESDYIGKKPEGFGAFNPAWKPSDNEEYVKLSEGKSNIIKETAPVNNSNPLGWRTTTYGYVGDNFNGDENSKNGIGNNDNVLRPGDIAVSPDVLEQIRKMKPEWANGKQRIPLILMRGGKFYRANFRIADVTAKSANGRPLTGRVDIFTPAGTKDQANRYNDMVVVTIGKDNIQQLKTEEVKTPSKKPLAKPVGRKVESKAPSVSDARKRRVEIDRLLNAKPKNMFEGYGG